MVWRWNVKWMSLRSRLLWTWRAQTIIGPSRLRPLPQMPPSPGSPACAGRPLPHCQILPPQPIRMHSVATKWSLPAILHSGHLALSSKATHIHAHSLTIGKVKHARRQSARQEQLGLGVFLRDIMTLIGGAGDRTSNLSVTSPTALPCEIRRSLLPAQMARVSPSIGHLNSADQPAPPG